MEEAVKKEGSEDFLAQIREVFGCGQADVRAYSPLTLAYIGDAVYEVVIRSVIVGRANRPANELHKHAVTYVQAAAQAAMAEALLPELTDDEEAAYRRGRNAKSYTMPKHSSVAEYRKATGLEALVGYLYLTGQNQRLLELIRRGIEKAGLVI